jgi:O-methyltransferase involved in polyketide biosynthesis
VWYDAESGDLEITETSSAAGTTVTLDTNVPNAARIYDLLLGGKNGYAADRAAAAEIVRQLPHAELAARQNRWFLGRVVKSLVQSDIRQFLDIGSGLPTSSNVHQIAQEAAPESRVVYVDYDAVVVGHARALLEKPSKGVTVLAGDLRDPGQIIRDAKGALNFSEPVAVLLFAVLHFLRDDEKPHEFVRTLTGALAPGSFLAVSHITDEGTDLDTSLAAQQVYQGASAPAVPRSLQEITRFFDGLELMEPGATDIASWPVQEQGLTISLTFYGGVARKA